VGVKMRNKTLVISTVLSISALMMLVSCQQQKAEWKGTIEEVDGVQLVINPEMPLSKNAGRERLLKEVLQIKDVGDEYYFKNPNDLKVAPDGSIFINDKGQFLHFSEDGKFICNYFKMGQGPGEMTGVYEYCIFDKSIILQNVMPPKLLIFDLNGNLEKEVIIKQKLYFPKLKHFHNGHYYFIHSGRPVTEKMAAIVDVAQNLICISQDGSELKEFISFPTRQYIERFKRGGRGIVSIDELITVPYQKKYLVVSHAEKYLLKLYDLEVNQIIRMFTREYPRVKVTKEYEIEKTSGLLVDGKPLTVPGLNYQDDVKSIFISHNQIWVMTSTVYKKKGTLFDVYDFDGKYIDNFYLNLPDKFIGKIYGKWQMDIKSNFLYTIEGAEEGTYVIKKYKIENKN
jgi:hypothetical protein